MPSAAAVQHGTVEVSDGKTWQRKGPGAAVTRDDDEAVIDQIEIQFEGYLAGRNWPRPRPARREVQRACHQ